MRKVKKVKVNEARLRDAIESAGYTIEGAANRVGRSHGYFHWVFKSGEITPDMTGVIETVLKISPDVYVIEEEPTKEVQPVYIIKPEVEKALLEIMKRAVREVLAE